MKCVGIDFSGAVKPAVAIGITIAEADAATFKVKACFLLSQLLGPENDPYLVLGAFIRDLGASLVGMDFPFSLPATLMPEGWSAYLSSFDSEWTSPEDFRSWCRQQTGTREIKRACDVVARTPFSPYNLRMFRQTFYGCGRLLKPLVMAEEVTVSPFQSPKAGKPTLLEACPASYLKSVQRYPSYKGSGKERARQGLVDYLVDHEGLDMSSQTMDAVVQNAGGDLLDSLICAVICAKHGRIGLGALPLEPDGHVYF